MNDAPDRPELDALQTQLDEANRRASEAEEALANAQRIHVIECSLRDAGTIDLEAARMLIETTLAHMDEPDVDDAIVMLRRDRPYLFPKQPERRTSGAMSATPTDQPDRREKSLADAALAAQSTGHRNDLLRYMRMRRST